VVPRTGTCGDRPVSFHVIVGTEDVAVSLFGLERVSQAEHGSVLGDVPYNEAKLYSMSSVVSFEGGFCSTPMASQLSVLY